MHSCKWEVPEGPAAYDHQTYVAKSERRRCMKLEALQRSQPGADLVVSHQDTAPRFSEEDGFWFVETKWDIAI